MTIQLVGEKMQVMDNIRQSFVKKDPLPISELNDLMSI